MLWDISNLNSVNKPFGVSLTIPEAKSPQAAAASLYLSLTPEGSWAQ